MKTRTIQVNKKDSDYQYIETLQRNRTKRARAGEFFVEGVRAINQVRSSGWTINALLYSRDNRLSDWAEEVIRTCGTARHYVLSAGLLAELSQKEESSEIMALVAMPPNDLERIPIHEDLLVVVLDRPGRPGNIGSILRSCDSLSADGLVITGHSADLFDPEVIRATTGSFFSVPAVMLPSHKELLSWVDHLKEDLDGLQLIGTSSHASRMVWEIDFTLPTILVAGNESHGLSEGYREVCDVMTKIPMHGTATSLNLAAATSILLYEVERQRSQGKSVA